MKPRSGLFLLLILACAAGLLSRTGQKVRFQEGVDEGVYLYYAQRVAREGPAAIPKMCQEYLEQRPVRQYYPTPLRLTPILVNAAAVRLMGPRFTALQMVSVFAFLALLVLVFLHLRGVVGDLASLGVVLLLAASPLHLAMAQRALSDSLVATLSVAALACFLHALEEPQNRRRWAAVGLITLAAFLAREATVVLVPISLVLLGWDAGLRGRRPSAGLALAASVLPLAAAGLFLALAAGGAGRAWEVLTASLGSIETNSYARTYGGGPWFRYLADFLLISPWSLLLYLLWTGRLLTGSGQDWRLRAWALVPWLFLICTAFGTKNVRYALLLETPIRMGAFLLLLEFAQKRSGRWAKALWLAVPLAAILAADLASFLDLFVEKGIYDPVSAVLLRARGLIGS